MAVKGVKKPPGMYRRTGELVLTSKNQAPELVFPERNGGHCFISDFPGRIDQADDPFLQEALERGGYEAFADCAPRGPAYPLFALAIAAEMYAYEHEPPDDRYLEGFDADSGEGIPDLQADISDNTDNGFARSAGYSRCDKEACPCHGDACMFAGHIKERIGRPAAAFAKFPRGTIPLSCAQCENY